MTTHLYDIVKPVMEKFPDAMPKGVAWNDAEQRFMWGCRKMPNDIAELAIIGAWVKWLAMQGELRIDIMEGENPPVRIEHGCGRYAAATLIAALAANRQEGSGS